VPTGSTASIASVTISWGDGTSTTVPGNITSASHTYTAAGSYTVTVTATDTNGQQGTASTVVSVVP
jgi:PKD repeat protein